MSVENNRPNSVNCPASQGTCATVKCVSRPDSGTEAALGQYVSHPTPYEAKYLAWLLENPSKATVNHGNLLASWED